MNQFTQDELKNILGLISITPITGKEAVVVAMLQQKIAKLLTPEQKDDTPETK